MLCRYKDVNEEVVMDNSIANVNLLEMRGLGENFQFLFRKDCPHLCGLG